MRNLLFVLLLAFTSTLSATEVLVLAGSTRSASYNKLLARQAAEIAREEGAKVTLIDLKDFPVPFYDADLEAEFGLPENVKRFRGLLMASDAVIIASPQYNDSIPAVLKNMLDWASRSEEGAFTRAAFQGKKFAMMSASPSKKGGAKGLKHLKDVLKECGADLVDDSVSIPYAHLAFDENGHLRDPAHVIALQEEVHLLFKK
jgi:chromate reductase